MLNFPKIKLLEEYIKTNSFGSFTLSYLKNYLIQRVGGGWNIFESSFSRAMRGNLKMTYKKINRVHPTVATNSNRQKILEASAIQMRLA